MKIKIYLLFNHVDYEGSTYLGKFYTVDEANKYMKENTGHSVQKFSEKNGILENDLIEGGGESWELYFLKIDVDKAIKL